MAKHVGFAGLVGRRREAFEHLARVNGVELGLVERLVDEAFRVWEVLSSIDKWKIVVGDVGGLEDVRGGVEELLNTMYVKRLSVERGWLVYRSSSQRRVERAALEETLELVSKAFGGVVKGEKFASKLAPLVRNILREYGVVVLERELVLAIEAAMSRLESLDLGRVEAVEEILKVLEGKWIVFVGESLRGKLFIDLIDRLKGRGLDYLVKTPASRKPELKEYPVAVYVPSFLALKLAAKIGITIKDVLEEYGVNKPIIFKPNIFAEKQEIGVAKPYIYKI